MAFNVDDDEGMGWGWLVGNRERCDATLDWNVERGGEHVDGARKREIK